MRASRRSHSTVACGSCPGSVKYRRIPIPTCSGAIAMSAHPLVRASCGLTCWTDWWFAGPSALNHKMWCLADPPSRGVVNYTTETPPVSTDLATNVPTSGNAAGWSARRGAAGLRCRGLLEHDDLALEV